MSAWIDAHFVAVAIYALFCLCMLSMLYGAIGTISMEEDTAFKERTE